ncbi:MAG: hypothetical protein AVDCRST_MAG17-1477, partial [uncultured Solirubrobacterales bacterium]
DPLRSRMPEASEGDRRQAARSSDLSDLGVPPDAGGGVGVRAAVRRPRCHRHLLLRDRSHRPLPASVPRCRRVVLAAFFGV